MRTCFTAVALTLWEQGLIVTVHCVHRLTMGPSLHNEGFDAGAEERWGGSRNLLLSLIRHSPGLLIQGKPLNHDCMASAEPAKSLVRKTGTPKKPFGFSIKDGDPNYKCCLSNRYLCPFVMEMNKNQFFSILVTVLSF